MSKNVFDISQELMSNAYPGRGIILGRTPDNKKKCYRLLHHGPLGEQPQPTCSPKPRTVSAPSI